MLTKELYNDAVNLPDAGDGDEVVTVESKLTNNKIEDKIKHLLLSYVDITIHLFFRWLIVWVASFKYEYRTYLVLRLLDGPHT